MKMLTGVLPSHICSALSAPATKSLAPKLPKALGAKGQRNTYPACLLIAPEGQGPSWKPRVGAPACLFSFPGLLPTSLEFQAKVSKETHLLLETGACAMG